MQTPPSIPAIAEAYSEVLSSDVELNEEKSTSSAIAKHELTPDQYAKHAKTMHQKYGVDVSFHHTGEKSTTMTYHGSRASVKKALAHHYGDEDKAKKAHPGIFKPRGYFYRYHP